MNGYYKLVVEQLKKHGYHLLRHEGSSHQTWTNGKRNQLVSTNCASRHTANGIMKQAAINHKF